MSDKNNEPYNKMYSMDKKYSFYIELKCYLIKHFMETKIWLELLPSWILFLIFFVPFLIGFFIGNVL